MEISQIIPYIKFFPIYLLFIGTFGQACTEKFFSGGVPDWFKTQFDKTFLNFVPGALTIQYYMIAVLEASVVVLMLFSIGRMEFLPGREQDFLKLALVMALFAFFALGFGLRISGDFQGAANLFMYFGVTFLIFVYVEKLSTFIQ